LPPVGLRKDPGGATICNAFNEIPISVLDPSRVLLGLVIGLVVLLHPFKILANRLNDALVEGPLSGGGVYLEALL